MQSHHDTLFGFTFRHVRHAAAWLRTVLPGELADLVDWQTLTPIGERFAGARLRPHIADAGFAASACVDGERRDLLLLVEHKSFDDPDLAHQLLRYSIHLQRSLQTAPGRRPLVLPVVLQHGRGARSRKARVLGPQQSQLLGLQPRQCILVDDLDTTDELQLQARGMTALGTLTLLCLRTLPSAPPHEVAAALRRWRHLLVAVDHTDRPPDAPPVGHDAIDAIGWYALAVTNLDSLTLTEILTQTLQRDDFTIMSTLERTFQQGFQAGKNEGRTEGKAEGKAEGLLRLMTRRFGALQPATAARVHAASDEQLDDWFDRVLDAPSLSTLLDGDR